MNGERESFTRSEGQKAYIQNILRSVGSRSELFRTAVDLKIVNRFSGISMQDIEEALSAINSPIFLLVRPYASYEAQENYDCNRPGDPGGESLAWCYSVVVAIGVNASEYSRDSLFALVMKQFEPGLNYWENYDLLAETGILYPRVGTRVSFEANARWN